MLIAASASILRSGQSDEIPAMAPVMAPGTDQDPSLRAAAQPGFESGSVRTEQPNLIAGIWIPEGPAAIRNGQAHASPNDLLAGSTKTVAVNPSDANVLYVG